MISINLLLDEALTSDLNADSTRLYERKDFTHRFVVFKVAFWDQPQDSDDISVHVMGLRNNLAGA